MPTRQVVARVGTDGQPYWSARDLAKLFGYSDWRNFAAAINKACEQVRSHIAAGRTNGVGSDDNGGGHFVNTEIPSRVGFGDRMIPDVHLTRFAAYFVALNAEQFNGGDRVGAGRRPEERQDALCRTSTACPCRRAGLDCDGADA